MTAGIATLHVIHEPALFQMQQPLGPLGGVRIVRHHEDGLVQLLPQNAEEVQDFVGRFGIKIPVGSSATINVGSVTIARAMPTRCCCPPDSMPGR